jgi:Replication protein P
MKHVSNLIDISSVREYREPPKDHAAPDNKEKSASIVNLLFKELKASFPAFKQAWPTDDDFNRAKLTWVKAFSDAKINTIEQLRHGIKKCRLSTSPFAPSVGQFIEWCKPSAEDLGFPTADEAYMISIKLNQQFSNYHHEDDKVDTVIRHTVTQIGSTTYREMKIDNAKKAFKTYYDIALRQFMNDELTIIPRALPEKAESHPDDKARSDEAREKAMEAIRKMGIGNKRAMQEDPV